MPWRCAKIRTSGRIQKQAQVFRQLALWGCGWAPHSYQPSPAEPANKHRVANRPWNPRVTCSKREREGNTLIPRASKRIVTLPISWLSRYPEAEHRSGYKPELRSRLQLSSILVPLFTSCMTLVNFLASWVFISNLYMGMIMPIS